MPLSPGSKLGRYDIVSFVGAGGMGEVYRARDTGLGRDVALKVLRNRESGGDARRLTREARAASALKHPNIAIAVAGDRDTFSRRAERDALAAAIRGAIVRDYAGVGHALHWEEPVRVARDIAAFLQGL